MNYRYIGRSGLRVSPICMGTMTFGTQCDKKEAFRIMDKAYEHGVNFYDLWNEIQRRIADRVSQMTGRSCVVNVNVRGVTL